MSGSGGAEELGLDMEATVSDDPVVDIDLDARTVTRASGEIVPIEELHELRPGLWGYMAGPTADGSWLVGQAEFEDDTGIN